METIDEIGWMVLPEHQASAPERRSRSDRAGYDNGVQRMLTERPDEFVRRAFFIAWVLGMIGIVGSGAFGAAAIALILPAGLLIVMCGIVCFRDRDRVLDRLSDRYLESRSFRWFGKARFTKFEAALLTVIGVGWAAMGTAALIGNL